MVKIYPIPEDKVLGVNKEIYEDIKITFNIASVPVNFKYMANFPEFFEYAWKKIKVFTSNESFKTSVSQISELTLEMIKIIFSSDNEIKSYVDSLSSTQRKELEATIQELIKLNTELLIISIGIRESLKGIVIGEQNYFSNNFISNENSLVLEENNKEISTIERDIEVLYPEFYKLLSVKMKELATTEKYLYSRVKLEKFTQKQIENLPNQLNFPFNETVLLLRRSKFSEDLLFLLHNTFPSGYPHALMVSCAMKISIDEKNKFHIA